MKRISIFLLLLTITLLQANPTFTIGSNPYFTFVAYPHDILKWPASGAFVTFHPQTLPWQGDVTDISNRPNESYVNNYQQVEFAPPDDYTGNPQDIHSWMNVSSYAYRRAFTLGGIQAMPFGTFYLELGRTSTNMELTAEGVGRAYEENGESRTYYMVPFKGETQTSRYDTKVQFIYAHKLFHQPFAVKLHYLAKSADKPAGYINFMRDGRSYALSHLTWGWATTGCNHIFGYSHINTDAFFQNSYSVFAGYQLDLQTSFEINDNFKSGIRYRRLQEDGENYRWKYDDGSDFQGQYFVDQYWKDRLKDDLLRAYSKVCFWRFDNLDVGMLFFLQYASYGNREINKIAESDPGSIQAAREFVIETNPFFNYTFKGGYTDFGILLELSRTGRENTSTRWNRASQSDQTNVLWSSSPYYGWSPHWETFSKGSDLFFATGFESHSSIAVYKRLSLLVTLTVMKKFTFLKKSYGESAIPDGGSSFEFTQTHLRNDQKNETWMTGAFGLAYGRGPIQFIGMLQLPLAYLIKQKTLLREASNTLFEHEKRNMWQVQEPTSIRLFLIYAFGHPHK